MAIEGVDDASAPTATVAAAQPWPSSPVAWYTVFVMVLSLTFLQLDLRIVTLLIQPIKRDLRLTDWQLGLILGLAFAAFYALVGLPVARYIDRSVRKTILAIGLATWSVATAATGLAQNFWHLLIARFFVGAGESVNGPASFSILADLFPRDRLTRAVAVLQLGQVLGPALGTLLAAYLMHQFLGIHPIHVPWGLLRGWQVVFIIVGLPGVLVAVLMQWTMPEPARRRLPSEQPVKVSMRTCLRYVFIEKWRVYLPFYGSTFLSGMDGYVGWMPAFYTRTFGWNPAKVAAITGAAQLIATPLGLLGAVLITEFLSRRGRGDASYLVVVATRLVALPLMIGYILLPSPWLVLAGSIAISCVMGLSTPGLNASMQMVTPNQMRGQITAIYLLIFSVMTAGIGFSVIAFITDFVVRDEAKLKWSIFMAGAIFHPLAFLSIASGLIPFRREMARIRAAEAAAGASA